MARIGFIGLGHMGLPMAINLVKAGHTISGYDLNPEPMNVLVAAGGVAVSRAQAAAIEQDVVVTMLQTGDQVQSLMLGEQGFFSVMKPGCLHIDCSTIDVASAREIHQQADHHGILSVDAPVSGGVAGATAGTLTFMVGGQEAAFDIAKPILEAMGQQCIYTGPAGSGQAAKICNNMILGVSMIAVSEAFVLAETLGLSPQKLHEVVTNASGQCWVMSKYPPVANVIENAPANHDYQPGFTAAMMLKDLRLSQQVASQAGLHLPMGTNACALYQAFDEAGKAGLDFSAIIQLVKTID